MPTIEPNRLTRDQVEKILSKPNGAYALLECVRLGYIDAETAVTEIDRVNRPSFPERLGYALLNTFFSR